MSATLPSVANLPDYHYAWAWEARVRSDSEQPKSRVALLLVDVINGFDFEGSEGLAAAAVVAADNIRKLARRARASGIPVIYINDNFGRWRSDFRQIVNECSRTQLAGHETTRKLVPEDSDYFVLKPRHSAFYCTALEILLEQLGADRLILVGFAADICVLFTAHDAHMRGYEVWVPSDCVASNSPELTSQALKHVNQVSSAKTEDSAQIDFDELREGDTTCRSSKSDD